MSGKLLSDRVLVKSICCLKKTVGPCQGMGWRLGGRGEWVGGWLGGVVTQTCSASTEALSNRMVKLNCTEADAKQTRVTRCIMLFWRELGLAEWAKP